MTINDRLNELLGANQAKRIADDKARDERRDNPKILRHTTYQGDRNIQQLGEDIIENGVVLNNQSVAIGDVMLPLAKGNVLRRVDNTNGGALLGSAYRKAVENDRDANGNRRNNTLGRNGGSEPSNDSSSPNSASNKPKLPPRFPPPFGCTPPPPQCLWTSDPNVPNGYQSYGSAVVNENGIELFLYCTAGTAVPANLGCDFLDQPTIKYRCLNGVCSPDPNGIYNSLAECESARVAVYTVTATTSFWVGGTPCTNTVTGSSTAITSIAPPYTAFYNSQGFLSPCFSNEAFGIGVKGANGASIVFPSDCFNNAAAGVCGALGQPTVTITYTVEYSCPI
jgi:hypothetical protein